VLELHFLKEAVMSDGVFKDKTVKPDDNSLEKVLGRNWILWGKITSHLEENYSPIEKEWKFYNPKSGWVLKMIRKKRNLFFFYPYQDYFRVGFVYGDRAVEAAANYGLREETLVSLREARKYAEGRGISLDIDDDEDVDEVKRLIRLKVDF